MTPETTVDCVYCLRPMHDAQGWKVMARPDDGHTEFLCPTCLELPGAQPTSPERVVGEGVDWSASDSAAALPCACGHLPVEHDMLATRYCAATEAAGLSRACACPVKHVAPARSYDRR